MGLTKAEQRKAAALIQQLLDLIDHGQIAADGPAGVALTRHLEGVMIALRALDLDSHALPSDLDIGSDTPRIVG